MPVAGGAGRAPLRFVRPEPAEISRYILLGEYDPLFVALLNVRHPEIGDDAEELARVFIEHLHRGIALLANRLKGPVSLAELAQASVVS